jgi:TonB family protein
MEPGMRSMSVCGAIAVALLTSPALSAQQHGDPLSSAVDAKGLRHRGSDYIGLVPWMKDRIKIVPLKYPYQARARHIQGSGLFRISLDLNTGSVKKVTLIQSTGSPMLDTYTTDALHRWRWKPGRWREIDVPITFNIGSNPSSR